MKSAQVCSYQISLADHDVCPLLYRNTSACNFDFGDRIIEGYFWTADKRYCSENDKWIERKNVGGNLQKSGCCPDEIKAANEYFLSKLENLSGKYNSNYDGEVVIANDYFVLNNVIDQNKELDIDGGGGGGGINPPVSETAMVNETKGLNICGKIVVEEALFWLNPLLKWRLWHSQTY